ncbi:MAG TPA: hypothetical protein VGI39_21730 [Polyangiaceae bacterium]|jgi:hypothetical protein
MRTFAIASLALALLACGGGTPARTSAEQSQIDARAIQTRISGVWKLVDYRPEVPLDAMTQALLSSQIQTMTVRFDNGRLLADSPAFHFIRTFQIVGAGGNLFKLIATDETGVSLTSSCVLSDDGTKISFRGETEPWRGMGTLSR